MADFNSLWEVCFHETFLSFLPTAKKKKKKSIFLSFSTWNIFRIRVHFTWQLGKLWAIFSPSFHFFLFFFCVVSLFECFCLVIPRRSFPSFVIIVYTATCLHCLCLHLCVCLNVYTGIGDDVSTRVRSDLSR